MIKELSPAQKVCVPVIFKVEFTIVTGGETPVHPLGPVTVTVNVPDKAVIESLVVEFDQTIFVYNDTESTYKVVGVVPQVEAGPRIIGVGVIESFTLSAVVL